SNYNDYLEIWMQRLVVKNLKESTTLSDLYIEQSKNELVKFCNSIIRGKEMIQIFNEDWLKDEHKIELSKFINLNEIDKLTDIISDDEIYLAEYNQMT
ncbi:reverse transcriptase, partial [Listeria monocytogenes]|nr:reverse transcriptase [Listeria monocytogenes]EGL4205092.1 reverse transcriptase [Listeria monocytogenes]EJI4968705.1 reverse transcriptase [Listeria monocytogenes]HAK1169871.1 reverse transcriptase [Listeria monocytogenes]HAO5717726.1 reverse transcriptase [Listeria monocytogenes]